MTSADQPTWKSSLETPAALVSIHHQFQHSDSRWSKLKQMRVSYGFLRRQIDLLVAITLSNKQFLKKILGTCYSFKLVFIASQRNIAGKYGDRVADVLAGRLSILFVHVCLRLTRAVCEHDK